VGIGHLAGWHRAARPSKRLLHQVTTGHPAHHAPDTVTNRFANRGDHLRREGRLLLDEIHALDFIDHSCQQGDRHWRSDRTDVVLDPDRDAFDRRCDCRVEVEILVTGRVPNIRRHRDHRVGTGSPGMRRELHRRRGQDTGDADHDRHAVVYVFDRDLGHAHALQVGQRDRLARVHPHHDPMGTRQHAEIEASPQ